MQLPLYVSHALNFLMIGVVKTHTQVVPQTFNPLDFEVHYLRVNSQAYDIKTQD